MKTSKGGDLRIIEGYHFTLKRMNYTTGTVRWRCREANSTIHCRVEFTTDGKDGEVVGRTPHQHQHAILPGRDEGERALQAILQECTRTRETPDALYTRIIGTFSRQVLHNTTVHMYEQYVLLAPSHVRPRMRWLAGCSAKASSGRFSAGARPHQDMGPTTQPPETSTSKCRNNFPHLSCLIIVWTQQLTLR